MKNTKSSDLHNDLDKVKSKLSFLLETSTAYQEKIASGDIIIYSDYIYGYHLLHTDIIDDINRILSKLENNLKGL